MGHAEHPVEPFTEPYAPGEQSRHEDWCVAEAYDPARQGAQIEPPGAA